jgi:hypothetical protein
MMPFDNSTATASAIGIQIAQKTLDNRKIALAKRAAVIAAHPRKMQVDMQITSAVMPPTAATIHTNGYLVAGGDSWFDYPFHDVLKLLHDEHGYNVESTAHAGESIEHMAYAGGQSDGIQRCLETVAARGVAPLAVLLSGGGDDMAGKEFGMLLNNATSGSSGWNEEIIDGLIEQRINLAYKTFIAAINQLCATTVGKTVPIIVHGYDYPVPDGRGVLGGWWILPGPWLKPGFDEKLYTALPTNIGLMQSIIDKFNAMLRTLPADFPNVHYLDLRGTLSTVLAGEAYKQVWGNELHPTEDGFSLVAAKFSAVLDTF